MLLGNDWIQWEKNRKVQYLSTYLFYCFSPAFIITAAFTLAVMVASSDVYAACDEVLPEDYRQAHRHIAQHKKQYLQASLTERGAFSPSAMKAAIPYIKALYVAGETNPLQRDKAHSLMRDYAYFMPFSETFKSPVHQALLPLYWQVLLRERIASNKPYNFSQYLVQAGFTAGFQSSVFFDYHTQVLRIVFECLEPEPLKLATLAPMLDEAVASKSGYYKQELVTVLKIAFADRNFKRALDASYPLIALADSRVSIQVTDPKLASLIQQYLKPNLEEKLRFYYGVSRLLGGNKDKAFAVWRPLVASTQAPATVYGELAAIIYRDSYKQLMGRDDTETNTDLSRFKQFQARLPLSIGSLKPLLEKVKRSNARTIPLEQRLKHYAEQSQSASNTAMDTIVSSIHQHYASTLATRVQHGAASIDYLTQALDVLNRFDTWLFSVNGLERLRTKTSLSAQDTSRIESMYRRAYRQGVLDSLRPLLADLASLSLYQSGFDRAQLARVYFYQSLNLAYQGKTKRALRLMSRSAEALSPKGEKLSVSIGSSDKALLYRAVLWLTAADSVEHLHADRTVISIVLKQAQPIAKQFNFSLPQLKQVTHLWQPVI